MIASTQKAKFERQARWREKNPLKRWAHLATASAIRRGLLTPQACEVCGDPTVDAHHADHANPLAVRWLCRQHHRDEHRRLKAEGGDQ
jgi:ribosomal protein S27AE